MSPKYREKCNSLSLSAMLHLSKVYHLSPRPGEDFYSLCYRSNVSHAQAILTLIRVGERWAVEAAECLLGSQIRLLPPAMPEAIPLPVNPHLHPAFVERKIKEVRKREHNREGWSMPFVRRLSELKVGRTVQQVLVRGGVTLREIRELVRAGVVVLG